MVLVTHSREIRQLENISAQKRYNHIIVTIRSIILDENSQFPSALQFTNIFICIFVYENKNVVAAS